MLVLTATSKKMKMSHCGLDFSEHRLVMTNTHVMMNGGTMQVQDSKKFWSSYIEKVITGEKQYIVEMKLEKFKFYVDFDYKSGAPISDDEAKELFTQWEQTIRGPVYVARTPSRVVDGFWKSGFHLIWSEKPIKKQGYTRLRNALIIKTPEVAKFIDTPTSGLRMLWSHKYPTGKPYVPWIRIEKGVISHLETTPNVTMLDKFSIQALSSSEDVLHTDQASISESESKLEAFIRKHIRGQGSCNIKKILRTKAGDICVQTDSSYCENLGSSHKSNHVWFLIRNDRIYQKCHCTCDVKRRFGVTCKKFTGKAHIVPSSILDEIEAPEEEVDDEINILDLF